MKVMSIMVSHNSVYPQYNNASISYIDEEENFELNIMVSYEEGMRELRKLEKRLNKIATLDVNRYNVHICTKQLVGIIG